MTQEQAIEYCYRNESKYVADLCDSGEDGQGAFDCLIEGLRSGSIRPDELASYGMDYE